MNRFLLLSLSLFFSLGITSKVSAQIDMTAGTTSYGQNFDGLNANSPGSNVTWTDNTTLTGWFTNQTNYRTFSTGDATPPANRIWSCGAASGNTDRGLGAFMTSTTIRAWGVQLRNTTGSALSGISIGFDAERWYNAGTGSTFRIQYSLTSTNVGDAIASASWTSIANITNPATSLSYNISPITLANNAIITIRFIADYSGSTTNSSLWATDNFFASWGALPLTLTNIKAYQVNSGIEVGWNVENESGIRNYEVERSANGQQFSNLGHVSALNSGVSTGYSYLDNNPNNGVNYYRLKIIDRSGSFTYSKVVKVGLGKSTTLISVYPNPVTDNVVILEFSNVAKGIYTVSMTNKPGQEVYRGMINHNGGSATELINISQQLEAGMYQLQVRGAELNRVIQVLVK